MPVKGDIWPNRWEHFPHDADVGIRGRGPTLAEAFEQAALALTGIVTDAEIAAGTAVDVTCEGAGRGDAFGRMAQCHHL